MPTPCRRSTTTSTTTSTTARTIASGLPRRASRWRLTPRAVALGVAALAALGGSAGCGGDPPPATPAPLTLRILHINDHHSRLAPSTAELTLAGAETRVELGGFPRVVAKFRELEAAGGHVLRLHAGDAITGDLYYTLFRGEADAALMNEVCFDAFAVGNHEFDDGDAGLRDFLDFLRGDASCETAVLAANIVPAAGSPLAPENAEPYLQPYVIRDFDGAEVGIIGIDIAGKTSQSSSPDPTTLFLDEAMTAQATIDSLRDLGVTRIVLLTHYQYANDLELAGLLDGVDVIVGGDSHTLLGEELAEFGLSPGGPYPTETTDAAGNPVCVVQAWQYANVVGELAVEFDAEGVVTGCSGTPHVLLGDGFEREGEPVSAAIAAMIREAIDASPALSIVTPDPGAEAVLAGFTAQVEALAQLEIGSAAEDLCLDRIPGEGRSEVCDAAATRSRGSDITNIVAKAFLEMSLTSEIAIQNAGGVRIDVPAGPITVGTAYTLLPFSNTLLEIELRGQELVDVLEDALEFALSDSTGAYPYAAGLRWDLDASKPFGQRFSNVEVNPRVAGEWVPLDPEALYRVVTNDYIAGGKDGYTTFGAIPEARKLNTYLDYAKSFVDYVEREAAAGRALAKLPLAEYSTQSFINPDGELQ